MNKLPLIFDTGCFVLIWMVQLVIYPSFQYFGKDELKLWHSKYTKLITLIVLPLMLGQLLSAIYQILNNDNFMLVLKLALILSIWLMTFSIFVPLHRKIDTTDALERVTKDLVAKNWIRTALWSVIFVLSLMEVFIP